MATSKRRFGTGLIGLLAVSLFLCPLALGSQNAYQAAQAAQPFNTVVPPNVTFRPPIGTVQALPTPIPTVGPGQFFEEGEENLLPGVIRPDRLKEPFGYSEILGKPGLYLVWSTDDDGNKRYYVLDKGNEYLMLIEQEVDNVYQDRLDMQKETPIAKAIGGAAGGVVLGLVGIGCGVGAVVSLAAEPVSAPATALLGACAGTAFTFSLGAFGIAFDGASRLIGHGQLVGEAKKQIESYFLQIPFSVQP